MKHEHDGTKTGAMGGELIGCGERDCDKGLVFIEAPGMCSVVKCPVREGRGYLVVWRSMDLSRLRGPA